MTSLLLGVDHMQRQFVGRVEEGRERVEEESCSDETAVLVV